MVYDEGTYLPVETRQDYPTPRPFQPLIYIQDQMSRRKASVDTSAILGTSGCTRDVGRWTDIDNRAAGHGLGLTGKDGCYTILLAGSL